MNTGPQPFSAEIRWQRALEISAHLQNHFETRLLAIGVYGSIARDSDGPYSDIEMHCVITGTAIDESIEWSAGEWKAEVDILSPDVILGLAAQVDGEWPITHGAYMNVRPIYDPDQFFPHLRETVFSPPEPCYTKAIKDVIIGEIYELVGKIRNAQASQVWTTLPYMTLAMMMHCACMVGLSHRHLYTSLVGVFTESLSLPNLPQGYLALCKLATSGQLDDPVHITRLVNDCWDGIEIWAVAQGINLQDDFSELLAVNLI